MEIDFNAPEVVEVINKKAEEIAGGLKKKTTELMDELKPLKEKMKLYDGVDVEEYKRLKEEVKAKEETKLDGVELRKRLEKEYADKLTAEQRKAVEAEARMNTYISRSELSSALLKGGVTDTTLMDAALALINNKYKIEINDGGASVDGEPVSSFVSKWLAENGKAFIVAPANGGGGANGGKSGGAAKTISRAEFDNLSQAERLKVVKDGFKVTN